MKAIECVEVLTIPDGYEYEVTAVTEVTKWDLMPRVRPLHEKLGLKLSRTEREVFYNLKVGTEVGIIKKSATGPEHEAEDVAFVAQSIEEFYVSGRQMRILSIAAKVVAPEHQRHQLGTYLAQEAILRLHPEAVTGRTPNPNAIRAYEKTGFIEEIYPIDKLYPWSIQTAVAVMLGREGMEENKISLRTGRCQMVYPPGTSRTFIREEMSESVDRIFKIMVGPAINANLEEGDGVRYWAPVNRRIYACLPEKAPVAA